MLRALAVILARFGFSCLSWFFALDFWKKEAFLQVDNAVRPHRHREAANCFPLLLGDVARSSLPSSVLAGPAVMLTSSLQLPTGRVFCNTHPITRNNARPINVSFAASASRLPTTNLPVLVYGTHALKRASVSVSVPPLPPVQCFQFPCQGATKTSLRSFQPVPPPSLLRDRFFYVWGVGGQVFWIPALVPQSFCLFNHHGVQYCYIGQAQYFLNIRLTGTVGGRGVGTPVNRSGMETRWVTN